MNKIQAGLFYQTCLRFIKICLTMRFWFWNAVSCFEQCEPLCIGLLYPLQFLNVYSKNIVFGRLAPEIDFVFVRCVYSRAGNIVLAVHSHDFWCMSVYFTQKIFCGVTEALVPPQGSALPAAPHPDLSTFARDLYVISQGVLFVNTFFLKNKKVFNKNCRYLALFKI